MAGPWFAVHRSGDAWQTLDQIWLSNGQADGRATIQIRIELQADDLQADDDRHLHWAMSPLPRQANSISGETE